MAGAVIFLYDTSISSYDDWANGIALWALYAEVYDFDSR